MTVGMAKNCGFQLVVARPEGVPFARGINALAKFHIPSTGIENIGVLRRLAST